MAVMATTRTGLSEALVAVGDRWSMLVAEALLGGAKRFGDLEDEIDGIAPNILSARLRKLTDHGLVSAAAYSDRPPRFSYELTDAGRELEAPLRLLEAWAERHRPPALGRGHESAQGEDPGRPRALGPEPDGVGHDRAHREAADHGSIPAEAAPFEQLVQEGRQPLVGVRERLGLREADAMN